MRASVVARATPGAPRARATPGARARRGVVSTICRRAEVAREIVFVRRDARARAARDARASGGRVAAVRRGSKRAVRGETRAIAANGEELHEKSVVDARELRDVFNESIAAMRTVTPPFAQEGMEEDKDALSEYDVETLVKSDPVSVSYTHLTLPTILIV